MNRMTALVLSLIFVLLVCAPPASAEDPADVIGTWYLVGYQDLDNYPGVTFRGNGDAEYFMVYTDGEKYIMVDKENHLDGGYEYRDSILGRESGTYQYRLEGDQLVCVLGYDGADHAICTYARQPLERQVGGFESCERVSDFDGEWTVAKYGMNNAFVDADEINLEGKATIENGHLTLNWTRDGVEKSAEITFDTELNQNRLYAVVDESVRYIVTRTSYNTLLLNVGLDQAQWVFNRVNPVSMGAVYVEDDVFDAAFAEQEDWFAAEETRNRLAVLLLQAAVRDGVDVADLDLEGGFYLADLRGCPLLVCGGKGPCKDYIFAVGRTSPGTGLKIYHDWKLYERFSSFYDGDDKYDMPLVQLYVMDLLGPLSNGSWPVEVNLD